MPQSGDHKGHSGGCTKALSKSRPAIEVIDTEVGERYIPPRTLLQKIDRHREGVFKTRSGGEGCTGINKEGKKDNRD